MSKWVSVWGQAMSITEQNPGGYAKEITLTYPVLMPLDGNEVKLTFDNFTGFEDVKIERVTVSKLVEATIIDETTLRTPIIIKTQFMNIPLIICNIPITSQIIPLVFKR